ncbi:MULTISPECIES: hypothetical protein [unclassified Rhodococcus (in: high G+C Gram-positive bacteria)]|jgi:hypothetical protein|uniref:hypothetical protein n=1 Tax=unclassified Rhodococcus (in: high G+C Gram-positive bacteria) TaxID=192944 RepID=UPI000B3C7666|nr:MULTISPECIES: hypothetical protein [unclassified Rhodococcus (in: high G+C Gram-positive bacteria)]KAF0958159.1 hypothetical protein MLGJGCBP_08726 [Rhodococcus sp. T7]OUS94969.1 hypothetical protein CA951_16110 [Rhodococcus sp. NCIMB 12038]
MSGWRAVADLIARWLAPPYPPLIAGERYICDLSGVGKRLADLRFLRLDEWVEACGEGVLHQGGSAVFVGARGDRVEISRANVLWRHDEHPRIVAATGSLAVPLVPPRRLPTPVWRVGSTRIDVPGMVELGRLIDGGQ